MFNGLEAKVDSGSAAPSAVAYTGPLPAAHLNEILGTLRAVLQDRYAVERELGRGGMATVYLARDVRHERPVALKVLARGDQADPRPAGRPYLGISSDLAPSPGDAW
jgi:hypothetical protein